MITSEPEPFITATELKNHLNKTSATPDDEFELFIETSCEMIRDRMGQVSPVTAVEALNTRRDVLILEHTPVISIDTITDSRTGLEIPPYSTNVRGWLLDGREGVLRHSHRFPGAMTIEYTAGRVPTPPNYKLAALELGAHLWRSSQQNSAGGRPPVGGGDGQVVQGTSWALPYSVRQLLGLDKQPRAGVWVG